MSHALKGGTMTTADKFKMPMRKNILVLNWMNKCRLKFKAESSHLRSLGRESAIIAIRTAPRENEPPPRHRNSGDRYMNHNGSEPAAEKTNICHKYAIMAPMVPKAKTN